MVENIKPCCPICREKMRIDYGNDQDGERGYYATCDNCNIYFGLDPDAIDMGYCWGKYGSEEAVIKKWNDVNNSAYKGGASTQIC